MGPCVAKTSDQRYQSPNYSKKNTLQTKPCNKFTEMELYLLALMYDDLAKRCKNSILSRDTFYVFFHANGLMAELMFSKFDQQKTGTISREQFVKAFDIMVKGSFQEKANALFEFYSMERSGGIRYPELLRILFSYPIEELNIMLFDQKFLQELGDRMITYYFGPQKKIEQKIILEDASEQSSQQPPRKSSTYYPESYDLLKIQGRIRQLVEEEKEKKDRPGLPPIFKKENMNNQHGAQKHERQAKLPMKSGSMSLIQLKKIRKSCQLKSNISSVIKRYATYLFTSSNLDKDKDVLSKRQFCDILKAHPSIFDVYLSGFHTYIWQVSLKGQPDYCNLFPQVEGEAKLWAGDISISFYLKLIKTTIFIFQTKSSERAKDVINLQGLTVKFLEIEDKKCLQLSHRDGLYPQKMITFEQRESEWFKQLQEYKESSILDDYIKLQRIGKGNFSNVYRCKQKDTGSYAALKVIEPNKLTASQREVLKREIDMLKQCHHQNIVKFIQQYKTNTHIYIVTELLTEGDLFQYTRKNSFLEEYQAAIIFRQLTQAILYLNEMGIIHRDLKPQNVMILMAEDKKMVRRAKIIDFGFGVYKDQLKDLSQGEKYAGTPGFIAPEVYEMKEYDQKIDTFSLGIILYFMLYGYLPFQSNYFQQIREQTLSCNIALTNNHWNNVSKEAKDLIYKILTFADQRISTKQILDHPWLHDIDSLKDYQGKNKKRVRILD